MPEESAFSFNSEEREDAMRTERSYFPFVDFTPERCPMECRILSFSYPFTSLSSMSETFTALTSESRIPVETASSIPRRQEGKIESSSSLKSFTIFTISSLVSTPLSSSLWEEERSLSAGLREIMPSLAASLRGMEKEQIMIFTVPGLLPEAQRALVILSRIDVLTFTILRPLGTRGSTFLVKFFSILYAYSLPMEFSLSLLRRAMYSLLSQVQNSVHHSTKSLLLSSEKTSPESKAFWAMTAASSLRVVRWKSISPSFSFRQSMLFALSCLPVSLSRKHTYQ